jgi:predicted Zn-dependent protease with MMP-like domain
MVDVAPDEFAELVADALDSIPPDLGRYIDNVAVMVDDDSPPGSLFGVYHGVPLTQRMGYGGAYAGSDGSYPMPDRIVIFRQTICASCATPDDVVAQVKVTVIHEIAHHFGIDDARLRELGWG